MEGERENETLMKINGQRGTDELLYFHYGLFILNLFGCSKESRFGYDTVQKYSFQFCIACLQVLSFDNQLCPWAAHIPSANKQCSADSICTSASLTHTSIANQIHLLFYAVMLTDIWMHSVLFTLGGLHQSRMIWSGFYFKLSCDASFNFQRRLINLWLKNNHLGFEAFTSLWWCDIYATFITLIIIILNRTVVYIINVYSI